MARDNENVLAIALEDMRIQKGMTPKDFAYLLQTQPNTYIGFLSGVRELPRISERAAFKLGIPAELIFGCIPDATPTPVVKHADTPMVKDVASVRSRKLASRQIPYANRPIEELGKHLNVHMNAIPKAGLNTLREVAGELAYRDWKIDEITRAYDKLAITHARVSEQIRYTVRELLDKHFGHMPEFTIEPDASIEAYTHLLQRMADTLAKPLGVIKTSKAVYEKHLQQPVVAYMFEVMEPNRSIRRFAAIDYASKYGELIIRRALIFRDDDRKIEEHRTGNRQHAEA